MTKTAASAPAVETLSFEEAMAELERIVRDMDSGKTTLDDSIAAYERGVALRIHCQARLDQARLRIDQIAVAPDGSVSVTPTSQS